MLPVYVQVILAILVPAQGIALAYFFNERSKRKTEERAAQERLATTSAQFRAADLEASDKLVGRLLNRVDHLEENEAKFTAGAEARLERVMRLESENARLEAKVEALKFELAGKINASMNHIAQQTATALSESMKQSGDLNKEKIDG